MGWQHVTSPINEKFEFWAATTMEELCFHHYQIHRQHSFCIIGNVITNTAYHCEILHDKPWVKGGNHNLPSNWKQFSDGILIGCSVGIVRSRTKGHGVCLFVLYSYISLCSVEANVLNSRETMLKAILLWVMYCCRVNKCTAGIFWLTFILMNHASDNNIESFVGFSCNVWVWLCIKK
jgi:hypothetical protein